MGLLVLVMSEVVLTFVLISLMDGLEVKTMKKRSFKEVVKELEVFIKRKLTKDEKEFLKVFIKHGWVR